MNTLTFDKLAFVDKLKTGGFTEEQARTQADALDTAIKDTVATKRDVEFVRRDLGELEMRLDARVDLLQRDLTIRLGGMMVIAVGAFAALVKLL